MIDYIGQGKLFEKLHERMDEAINLYRLEEYVVLENKDGYEMENTSKIILNDPRVFGDAVMSILAADKQSIEITGVDASVQKKIEDLLSLVFPFNDEMLELEGIESLDSCLNFQTSFRGWPGVLPIIIYDKYKKKYLFTAKPIDTRWAYWDRGYRGFNWTLNWIRKAKEAAEKQYDKVLKTEGKLVDLACIWDGSKYHIHESINGNLDEDPLDTYEHNFGFCPTVIQSVGRMPHLISTGNTTDSYSKDLMHQGEDIYAPVKRTILDMNELASIWKTLDRMQFETPMQLKGGEGKDLSGVNIYGYGIVVGVGENQEFLPMPSREMAQSAIQQFNMLFSSYQRATMAGVNFGEIPNRAPALAIADAKGDRDKIMIPLRDAKSKIISKVINNWRRQFKAKKFYEANISADEEEFALNEADIDPTIFDNKFVCTVRYDSISPQENMVNAQLINQLRMEDSLFPDEWLLSKIAHVKDPQGMLRKGKQQRLRKILPDG